MSDLTQPERDLILHSLGMSRGSKPYRNFFAASAGHADAPTIKALCKRGLMFEGRTSESGLTFYHVSDTGCRLVGTTRAEAEA